jgi:hypothetical protein
MRATTALSFPQFQSHRELTEAEFANHVLGLPADYKLSTPDEIRASNRAIQLIKRVIIAGDVKRLSGKDYFERRDVEQFAERIRNMPTGIERFFEHWHPPNQNECGWLLCCLDPGVARTDQELDAVWKDVCHAEEAVQRAIVVGKLAFIAKTEASSWERLYNEARFIRPGELLRWAIESGSFQSFVSLAQGYGLRPTEASREKSKPVARRKRVTSFNKREKIIRAAIRAGLRGEEYAAYLDEHGLTTPEQWQNRKDDPCPKQYVLAYESLYWRAMIQKEKSRITARMKR